MRVIIIGIIALLFSATLAGADIVATWKLSDGGVSKLSMRDDQHVRIDTNEKDTYMLLTDQKVYLVRKEEGQWSAFDMDQLSGIMKSFAKGTESSGDRRYQQKFKDTGRFETIAGYKGNVFEVELTDPAGKTQKEEIVLSSHPDIKKIHQGWTVFAARMAQMLGQDAARNLDDSLKLAKTEGRGGMLRYGKAMTLQSVEKPSLEMAYYQLPPGVEIMEMPDMGKLPPRQAAKPAQKGEDGFVTDTTEKAGEAAKDQTQQSVVEGVREGVKGIFKKVW
ncbi:MAG: hypothetical protein R6V60_20165 [Desulfobacterales bacterium]